MLKLNKLYLKILYAILACILFSFVLVGTSTKIVIKINAYSFLFILLITIIIFVSLLFRKKCPKIFDTLIGFLIGVSLVIADYTFGNLYFKILFVSLSMFMTVKVLPIIFDRQKLINDITSSFANILLLILIVIYATFSSVYNQIVMASIPYNFNYHTLCYIVIFSLFWFLFSITFLCALDYIKLKISKNSKINLFKSKDIKCLWFTVFCIILIGYSFWLIASYPANINADAAHSWMMAEGNMQLTNHHPVMFTWILKASIIFIKSPFVLILSQTIIQAVIWASAAVLLYRQGISKKYLYIMALFIVLMPNNGISTANLWKDMFFSLGMLLLTICLGQIYLKPKLKFSQSFLLIGAMFLIGMFRHNGMIPVIITGIVLSVFILKKYYRLIPVICILIVFGTKYTIDKFYPVSDNQLLASPVHAIGSVFYYDGNIDKDLEKLLTKKISKEQWIADFNPYIWDPYAVNVVQAVSEMSKTDVVKIYLKLFSDNPFIFIKQHLDMADIIYSVFISADPKSAIESNYHAYVFGIINPDRTEYLQYETFQIDQKPTQLTSAAENILKVSIKSTLGNTLVWHVGIYIIMTLLLLYYSWLNKFNKLYLLLIPNISNFFIIMLTTPAQTYRYNYTVFLVFPFVLLFYLSIISKKE